MGNGRQDARPQDSGEYKLVALGLIFFNYLSEAFQAKYDALKATAESDYTDPGDLEVIACVSHNWRNAESKYEDKAGCRLSVNLRQNKAVWGYNRAFFLGIGGSMSSNSWYIAVAGQQQGPMSEDDLKNKLRTGEINTSTLAFTQGMKSWTAVRDISQLRIATPPEVPRASSGGPPTRSHEIDYEIFGEEMQFVEVELDPNETVIAEAGAMMFMEGGIEMETRLGDGSEPDKGMLGKLFDGAKRKLTGESLFMTWFSNHGHGKKRVAFGAPYPGKIIPIDLREMNGELLCQKDAFLCAAMGTNVGIAFNKRIGAGLFGGEGFIMQRLRGDGKAFVHAGGTIIKKDLKAGEELRIDTGCIVAFTSGVNYDIQMVKGLKSMFFGGEGLFLATLSGPGQVWLQSLPFSRLADRIYAAAPQTGGGGKGEGSALGGIFRMIGGD